MSFLPSSNPITLLAIFPPAPIISTLFIKSILFRSQFPKPISRGYSTIHQKVTPGDKSAVLTHQKCGNVPNLVGRSGSAGSRDFQHPTVALTARPLQFVIRQRGNNDSGTYRIDPGTPLTPPNRLSHDPQRISPF